MHHSLLPRLHGKKPNQYSRIWRHRLTEVQEHVYQKPVIDVSELEQHLIQVWSATKRLINSETVLMRVWKPKANTLNTCYDVFSVNAMTFKSYITAVMNKLSYVSFHLRTAVRRNGQFCCSSIVNLLQYQCAKNYQNAVCKKNKRMHFLASQCNSNTTSNDSVVG